MIFRWWYILNANEFNALGLVSRTLTLDLEGIGLKNILVTKGSMLGITYEGIFLPVQLNGANPYSIDDHAVFIRDNGDLFLGIKEP